MVKHGIDFIEAQRLWNDPNIVERRARQRGEDRFAVIGSIEGGLWTAIVTYRDRFIRIISVRRARENERKIYYDQ